MDEFQIICFDVDHKTSKSFDRFSLLEQIIRHAATAIRIDTATTIARVIEREMMDSTGIGHGVAWPHAVEQPYTKNILMLVKVPSGIDWESLDSQPAVLIMLILYAAHQEAMYSIQPKTLSCLSRVVAYFVREKNWDFKDVPLNDVFEKVKTFLELRGLVVVEHQQIETLII